MIHNSHNRPSSSRALNFYGVEHERDAFKPGGYVTPIREERQRPVKNRESDVFAIAMLNPPIAFFDN
jgi:hypothetical protein